MKALALVGSKKSGKTSLGLDLVRELRKRGLSVAAVKHTSHHFDQPDTDTSRYRAQGVAVAGISPEESFLSLPGGMTVQQAAGLLGADLLVVEGGKGLECLPRLVLADGESEAERLSAGLGMAVYGQAPLAGLDPVSTPGQVADLLLESGFLLPGLDCGHCDPGSCRAMARAIVKGEADPADCPTLAASVRISSGGRDVALNPFTARIIGSGILGMVSELKGMGPGPIRIDLPGPGNGEPEKGRD